MAEANMKIIDVDVHPRLPNPQVLRPYLRQPWTSHPLTPPTGGYAAPFPTTLPESVPPSGGPPASDPAHLARAWIEPNGIEYAVLTGTMFDVSVLLDPDHAAALASAYNQYMAEQWLPEHPAFRGSIVVAPQDAERAVQEIERMAANPKMACVVLGTAQPSLLGQRHYHPIYAAAQRHGLPVAVHLGADGAGASHPPTPAGYPAHYMEYELRASPSFMGHLISLLCEGVPERYPELKFAFLGSGVSWLPHLMWRLDKNFKGLRSTVPWLKRFPSEYLREQFRFSTAPLEEPDDPELMLKLFDMMGAEQLLMYAGDYPCADREHQHRVLDRLSPEAKRNIMYNNAKALYRL